MYNKLKNLDELSNIVDAEKRNGKTIVFANGVFDILHVGHIRYLREARALGDILVVAANSDDSTRRLKGPARPHTVEAERIEILAELQCVSYVLVFNDDNVNNLISTLKPHIHAKGTDYTEESVPERDMVLAYGGRVAITGDAKTHSSTEMIQKVVT